MTSDTGAAVATWTCPPIDGRFACDDHLEHPFHSYHRCAQVAAPPAVTFRRLCQLTTASYSYGDPGSDALTPGADALELGHPFMVFEIVEFEPGRHITGRVSPSSRRRYGAIAVTYRADPRPGGSRIAVRINVAVSSPFARLRAPILAAADAIMMRRQLTRLAALAERDARTSHG